MKPAVFTILALTCLLTAFISCKKSGNEPASIPKSKTILLTQASWKLQSVALDMDKNGVPESDATSQIKACELDNTYTFKTDGSGLMDEAAARCEAADPQTKPFVWAFKSTETILSGTFGFIKGDAGIVSMTDTNLVITYDETFGTPTTYHILATLKH